MTGICLGCIHVLQGAPSAIGCQVRRGGPPQWSAAVVRRSGPAMHMRKGSQDVTNDKPLLRSVVPAGFDEIVADLALPSYRAAQLRQWVFGHGAMQWEQMSNLPGAMRQALSERFDLVGLHQVERQVSQDSTRKFLFELRDGNTIEAVIIPMAEHATFCLSTQVGCAMACRFCATARGGLVRNLTAGEIVEQVLHLRNDLQTDPLPQHGDRQFNVVFMGMGEPLDNWPALLDAVATLQNDDGLGMSRRRIQVSTSGPASGLRQLLASPLQIGLTVSLGGSTDNERRRVMPVPGRTPVSEVVDLATEYARTRNRKFTVALGHDPRRHGPSRAGRESVAVAQPAALQGQPDTPESGR